MAALVRCDRNAGWVRRSARHCGRGPGGIPIELFQNDPRNQRALTHHTKDLTRRRVSSGGGGEGVAAPRRFEPGLVAHTVRLNRMGGCHGYGFTLVPAGRPESTGWTGTSTLTLGWGRYCRNLKVIAPYIGGPSLYLLFADCVAPHHAPAPSGRHSSLGCIRLPCACISCPASHASLASLPDPSSALAL